MLESRGKPTPSVRAVARIAGTPRFWIYISFTAAVLVISYCLGKEMMWDTLDYHFYAGFSALHDRFGSDYFAAGSQSYLNPYVYAPFYALARSGLPAVIVASIIAAAQSGILWLTYELAVNVSSAKDAPARVAMGVCAALLALANPILLNQLGSSYADIITAEIVLAGWLLLLYALRAPSFALVASSGMLLGLAAALKLTNSLHALSACILLLFFPSTWRKRLQFALTFAAAGTLGFALVAVPWAIKLEHQFGNPLFPLFNNLFRSSEFTTTPVLDSRFVPDSLAAGIWRPFAIASPLAMVDDEYASPDLRYAMLLVLAVLTLACFGWRKMRGDPDPAAIAAKTHASRALSALGCAFLVDWILWLRISGNGRYFIAMACIAGVLAVGLMFRMLAARQKALGYLLVVLFAAQATQLIIGTRYRQAAAWDGGPWLEVSVPRDLVHERNLYLTLGEQSDSFIAPFLASGSGFINLDGDYVLGPNGANGAHVESLIRKYSSHLRVAVLDQEFGGNGAARLPDLSHVENALAPFGLRADPADCATIAVRDMRPRWRNILPGTLPIKLPQIDAKVIHVPQSPTGYLVTCHVISDPSASSALAEAEQEPNISFDRVEDACPHLFQPRRPVTEAYGNARIGYLWIRKYVGTNLVVVISGGEIKFVDGTRGGKAQYMGRERDWAQRPMRLNCGRRDGIYYAKLLGPSH